jgi:hypothetical protein
VQLISRASAGVVAVLFGLLTGWYSAGAGGSISRAPAAISVMAVGLGGAGLLIGLLLGGQNDGRGRAVALVLLLASYYAGLWMISPFHSLAGDLLVLIISSVPPCLGAMVGFVASRSVARWRRA